MLPLDVRLAVGNVPVCSIEPLRSGGKLVTSSDKSLLGSSGAAASFSIISRSENRKTFCS